MEFLVETQQPKKIGNFTDLHIGVQNDNKIRLNETIKCVDWIIDTFKKEKVDYVIFNGDLFNSRYSVNVFTLNEGVNIVQKLALAFEYVFLIVGNHDAYYKNTNEVNSVSFLQRLARKRNVFVIDQQAKFIKVNQKIIGLYPWEYDKEKFKDIQNFETPDFAFGHFNFNGAEYVGSISTGNKYNLSDMFDYGKIVFSGHYHNNKVYKCVEKNSYLYMVGSPLQLTWGDWNNDRKIITLNLDDKVSLKEFTNTVNARFEKIFYSDLENNKFTDEELKEKCKDNFTKLVVDKQYTFDKILKYNAKIKEMNPISFELDYIISIANTNISQSVEQLQKAKTKTNKDYLIQYLNEVYPEYKKVQNCLDINYLTELAQKYYIKAISQDQEEQKVKEN